MMDYWGNRLGWLFKPLGMVRLLSRANSRNQAKKNILAHYDLGNDMYHRFLNPRMQYSSAGFNSPEDSLADAQTNKLKRICEQLRLSENAHLLEVGTGLG